MQIPGNPLTLVSGLLRQPPLAGLQPKADTRVAPAAAPGRARSGIAANLEDAVRTLRAQGRIPPRGSLLDIQA